MPSAELGVLPRAVRGGPRLLNLNSVKDAQLLQPLFRFSGACAGYGETPYSKLLSQLFGVRAPIANATGWSSIYGGNLPTTPGPGTAAVAARHGPTGCSKTMPGSA